MAVFITYETSTKTIVSKSDSSATPDEGFTEVVFSGSIDFGRVDIGFQPIYFYKWNTGTVDAEVNDEPAIATYIQSLP